MRFEDQRARLVTELMAEGINDERVLDAFRRVPREDYVLPEYREYAYRNTPLPIELQQTISQPLMIAIMMQILELSSEDTVLEVGTGSGYQSALLAEIVKEVCTVERIDTLSLKAQRILKQASYRNVYFRIGDGWKGWQKAYPPYKDFPKIIVSAAAESIPEGLSNQLSEGGKMVIPVGKGNVQDLKLVQKVNGQISIHSCGGCTFVPLVREE